MGEGGKEGEREGGRERVGEGGREGEREGGREEGVGVENVHNTHTLTEEQSADVILQSGMLEKEFL